MVMWSLPAPVCSVTSPMSKNCSTEVSWPPMVPETVLALAPEISVVCSSGKVIVVGGETLRIYT